MRMAMITTMIMVIITITTIIMIMTSAIRVFVGHLSSRRLGVLPPPARGRGGVGVSGSEDDPHPTAVASLRCASAVDLPLSGGGGACVTSNGSLVGAPLAALALAIGPSRGA